jgi:hypothetical protein
MKQAERLRNYKKLVNIPIILDKKFFILQNNPLALIKSILIFIGLIFINLAPFTVSATPISIDHIPLTEENIETPGKIMHVPVVLNGTQRFDYRMRVHIVRDGVFMDITIDKGTLNDQEKPTYILTIPTPIREIRYRFFLYDQDNSLLAKTEEFKAARNCLPLLSDSQLSRQPEDASNISQAEFLALKSRALERHIFAYETATELLNELDGLLNAASTRTTQ